MKLLVTFFIQLLKWMHIYNADRFNFFVILDPRDNSITLSGQLFKHLKANAKDKCSEVFVFYIPQNDTFGFTQDYCIEKETQLCKIQYNDKYKCVGFESLCPSVGYILNHYNLPAHKKIKLLVSLSETIDGTQYYEIQKPKGK